MSQWIAEERVIFVLPDGTRSGGRIAIAAPVVHDEDYACKVVIEGLGPAHAIYGVSTLQALLLGIRFLESTLKAHQARGVRVELDDTSDHIDDDDDDDVDIVALLFGHVVQRPV